MTNKSNIKDKQFLEHVMVVSKDTDFLFIPSCSFSRIFLEPWTTKGWYSQCPHTLCTFNIIIFIHETCEFSLEINQQEP